METLSLCVPAYNAAEYLPRLLTSAKKQTVPFDEILVYDDCSTDDTRAVAEAYGATVISGDVNRGCSYGKNQLAEATRCQWVHFHDADDALYPNFVETAHKWMVKEDVPDVILFGYEWRDGFTDELLKVQQYDDEALRKDPVRYTILQKIVTICGIYRRRSFLEAGGFDLDPDVLYNEDVAMHCRLARAGLRFAADPTITVLNYRMKNSMSGANRIKCARAHYHVLRKSAEKLNGRYADEIAFKLWRAAGVSASYLDWETADAAVELAIRLNGRTPAHGNPLFRLLCAVCPHLAIRLREYQVRLLKPRFRQDWPRHQEP